MQLRFGGGKSLSVSPCHLASGGASSSFRSAAMAAAPWAWARAAWGRTLWAWARAAWASSRTPWAWAQAAWGRTPWAFGRRPPGDGRLGLGRGPPRARRHRLGGPGRCPSRRRRRGHGGSGTRTRSGTGRGRLGIAARAGAPRIRSRAGAVSPWGDPLGAGTSGDRARRRVSRGRCRSRRPSDRVLLVARTEEGRAADDAVAAGIAARRRPAT